MGPLAFMVGVPALRRCSGGRSSARAALRAASTGSMPANGGCSSNSWYAIMLKLYTSTCGAHPPGASPPGCRVHTRMARVQPHHTHAANAPGNQHSPDTSCMRLTQDTTVGLSQLWGCILEHGGALALQAMVTPQGAAGSGSGGWACRGARRALKL